LKIVIICQWYPPEYAPIGVMLQELSRDLAAKGHQVTVITGYPNHPSGVLFEGYRKGLFSEEMDGLVRIIRCWLYTSPKRSVVSRLLNNLSFALVSFLAALRLEKHDLLFMVSPPLSNGLIAMLLRKMKGLRFVFNVQDIYPDAAIAAGIIRNPLLIRALSRFEREIYRMAEAVTVISEGFKQNLIAKGIAAQKIHLVNNWIDAMEIAPIQKDNPFAREHGLADKFVVLYSGTIGLISGAGIILECAESLKANREILFLFVGEGVAKDFIMKSALERQLKNVLFLPFQPRQILSQLQSSADVSVVTLFSGRGKSSVPSKVLGYMAAARPVVACVDLNSDTARLVERANCGIAVAAEDAGQLTAALVELYRDRKKGERLGTNGRSYLVANCSRTDMTGRYESLFLGCLQRGCGPSVSAGSAAPGVGSLGGCASSSPGRQSSPALAIPPGAGGAHS